MNYTKKLCIVKGSTSQLNPFLSHFEIQHMKREREREKDLAGKTM